MSARRAVGYTLLVLLVLALIVAGGYLLYRLGFEQGRASAIGPRMHRIEPFGQERYSPWRRPGLRGGFIPRTRTAGFVFQLLGFGLGGLGILTLAISVLIVLLVRRHPNSDPSLQDQEVKTSPEGDSSNH